MKDSCCNIIPSLDSKLVIAKDKFLILCNLENKERFLYLLQKYLHDRGINVIKASSDADVKMCREAITSCFSNNVSLIGDDTDLLEILLHMTQHHYFEHKLLLTTKYYIYDIEKIRNRLGNQVVNSVLLIHAFTGCDTASRVHGIGKDKLQRA